MRDCTLDVLNSKPLFILYCTAQIQLDRFYISYCKSSYYNLSPLQVLKWNKKELTISPDRKALLECQSIRNITEDFVQILQSSYPDQILFKPIPEGIEYLWNLCIVSNGPEL